jgi:hypothetical protein
MKNYFNKNDEENLESIVGGKHQKINSTFTPIGRADCAPDKIFGQPRYMKSKIYEAKDFKKSKIEEVED